MSVAQPLVIGLLLVQVYSNAGFAYLLDRARRRVVCRRSFGADRREQFFERAVAATIAGDVRLTRLERNASFAD